MTDDKIIDIWESMPGGYARFLIDWGYLQFARKLLDAVEKPAPDLAPIKDELQFCIDNGTYGPRTGAALRWALEALAELEAEQPCTS